MAKPPRYAVYFKPSADRQLRRLPEDMQRRLVGEISLLALDPRPAGAVKLKGAEDLSRIRVGTYRIVYEIEDRALVVLVLRVAHRKDVYRSP
jgi:mRNA interferase RelE/StbE